MTAVANGTDTDIELILRRADEKLARRAGDDPLPAETITAFAGAVRPLIGAGASSPDAAFELQRRDDLITELRKHVEARDRTIDRAKAETERKIASATAAAEGDSAKWKREVERLTTDLNAARSNVERLNRQLTEQRRQLDAEHDQTRQALLDVSNQRDEQASKIRQLEEDAVEVANDLASAHQALDEQAAQNVEPHRHLYPWAAPGELPEPCACGQPYPRAELPEPRADIPEPEPEPWADLLGRVRTELAGWTPERKKR